LIQREVAATAPAATSITRSFIEIGNWPRWPIFVGSRFRSGEDIINKGSQRVQKKFGSRFCRVEFGNY